MAEIFKNIYKALERSNKKNMISSSGSTPDADHEKVRSGQSYLYKTYGMESEVVEIRFHKKVYGSHLNKALRTALERYPYLNTKLVELDGDFYIVQNKVSLVATRTETLPRLGHISCGYHLIGVTYYDKTVYVSFHHALCDGRGIMPFIETLIYYYCASRYRSDASSEGIRLADSPLLEGETTEPNLEGYDFDESKPPVEVSRDAYALPENVVEERDTYYRYELDIDSPSFMKACKGCGATPVVLTSLLMSAGIAGMFPDFDKPINANIAVDIRDALDLPNTFKNCVRSMPLPYTREFLDMPLDAQAKQQRALLNAQRDRDNCRRAANASLALFDKLDTMEGYEAKQSMMDFLGGMLLNTYTVSYLGQMRVNENAQYIDVIGIYNSGSTGISISMIACGDKFCFNFKQSFESDRYVEAFCRGLDEHGVEYSASEVIPFATPKDEIIKRG